MKRKSRLPLAASESRFTSYLGPSLDLKTCWCYLILLHLRPAQTGHRGDLIPLVQWVTCRRPSHTTGYPLQPITPIQTHATHHPYNNKAPHIHFLSETYQTIMSKSRERLISAVLADIRQNGLSYKKASSIYGIPPSTLYDRIYGLTTKKRSKIRA